MKATGDKFKEAKDEADGSDEEDDSEKEEEIDGGGSARPLPAAALSEEAKKVKEREQRMEQNLDWWSKFHISLKDLDEERKRNAAKRKKRKKRRRRVKGFRQKLALAMAKAVNFGGMAREKLKRKKKASKNGSSDDSDDDGGKWKEKAKLKKGNKAQAPAELDKSLIQRLKIYECELELVDEFGGLADIIHSFRIYRGKKTLSRFDERNRYAGTFKGNLRITEVPVPKHIKEVGFFPFLPSGNAQKYIVRVYIIRANNLHPMDSSGKNDPYIGIMLGKHKIKDKQNKLINQLNPVFGRCFELEANIPFDSNLTVSIWDWDRMSSDDLIGETTIDLEQRIVTHHRASCGISKRYDRKGYNSWRDCRKPTHILGSLCKEFGIKGPLYKPGQVTCGPHTFGDPLSQLDSENVALLALHRWNEVANFKLVPEHVERRTLYHPDNPGAPMGSVDMWIDMFPKGMPNPNPLPPVPVKPRKPKQYELRVIVWDTMEVIMEGNLLGDDSVDQYIKGYLLGPDSDCQQTDVHYRSMKGEGMFNYRFVYQFDYLDAEDKIVYKTKESFFSLSEHDEKIPPRLSLQVWDADTFSADDYLGTLLLELNKIPRGAKSSKSCRVEMMEPDEDPTTRINLFKQKRTRGWWPFTQYDEDGFPIIAGKVDLEMVLLTGEEAEKKPAGLGREAPEALPEPQRPETSFSMFSSPLKFLKIALWDNLKYKLLWLLLILLGLFFVGAFVYTLPEAVANKIVG